MQSADSVATPTFPMYPHRGHFQCRTIGQVFWHHRHRKQLYDANRSDQDLHLQKEGELQTLNLLPSHLNRLFPNLHLFCWPHTLSVMILNFDGLCQTYRYLLIKWLTIFTLHFDVDKLHFQLLNGVWRQVFTHSSAGIYLEFHYQF